MDSSISITGLYNNSLVLDDFSINLKKNNIVSIVAPSGSGKTTFLKAVAGFNTNCQLKLKSSGWISHATFSFASQSTIILQHLKAIDIIKLFISQSQNSIEKDVLNHKINSELDLIEYLVEIFNLKEHSDKYIYQLSFGTLQRLSLLCAIAVNKDVIIMDEPLSGVDYINKHKAIKWLISIRDLLNITAIIVTHDIDEAILISDLLYIGSPMPMSNIACYDVSNILSLQSQQYIDIKNQIISHLRI